MAAHEHWTCRHVAGSDFLLDHRTGTVTECPGRLTAGLREGIIAAVDRLREEDGPHERLPFQRLRQCVYDFFMGRLRDVESFVPLCADLELTARCNLRCRHCLYPHRGRAGGSADAWATVIDNLEALGCFALVLTGGEVLTSRLLFDVIAQARARDFIVALNTNGTLVTQALAEQMAWAGVHEAIVSVYGYRPETHDFTTNHRGSYRQTERGIRHLRAAGVPTSVRYVVLRHNFAEVAAAQSFWARENVAVHPTALIYPAHRGARTEPTSLRISSGDYAALVRAGVLKSPAAAACVAGWRRCRVDQHGWAHPCEMISLASLDLATRLADGAAVPPLMAADVRTFTPDACRACTHRTICSHCPGLSFLETNSFFEPSSEKCRLSRVTAS